MSPMRRKHIQWRRRAAGQASPDLLVRTWRRLSFWAELASRESESDAAKEVNALFHTLVQPTVAAAIQ